MTGQTKHGARRRRLDATKSEVSYFLHPLSRAVKWSERHVWLYVLLLAVLYGTSGITTIASNQVGLILRMGALVGTTSEDAVHGPGVLLALPRPFDTVLRIETSQIKTLEIDTLRQTPDEDRADNFLLTADRNILHSSIQVRYTIGDPVAYALHATDHSSMLRAAVLAAAVRETGAVRLDDLLGQQRGRFLNQTLQNAQARADAMGTGLQIVSIEFGDLAPPVAVADAFDAVQSANIAALTQIEDARAYAASRLPEAEAQVIRLKTDAVTKADARRRTAESEAAAFGVLVQAYQADPTVVVERLYREAIEQAFSQAADVTFVPAPEGPQRGTVNVTIGKASRVFPMETTND